MRRLWEIVWLMGLIALFAVMVPRHRERAQEKPEQATFEIETNGRPERLDDLVVTVRFTSPEPVEVGYIDNDPVTDLTLSIDRFDWHFQEEPLNRKSPMKTEGS